MEESESKIEINKYQPWVEKYRPKDLSEIKGQEMVKNTVNNMVSKGYFPNLIFHGSPGTGKTSFIFSLANKIYGDKMNYLVLELNASDDRGINVIRNEIKDFVSKNTLFANGIKLVILDEVDSMTPDAQYALRYLMDKYKNQVRFCLICNYYYKILDSIKSRCCVFRFLPLNKKETKKVITNIISKENIKLSNSIIKKIIDFGEGDIRKSINLLQSVSIEGKKINNQFVNLLIGDIDEKSIKKLLEILFSEELSLRKKILGVDKIMIKYGISLSNLIKIIFDNIEEYYLSEKMIELAELEYMVKQSTFSKTYLYKLICIFF
jgi:replication factor C subunit 3/5